MIFSPLLKILKIGLSCLAIWVLVLLLGWEHSTPALAVKETISWTIEKAKKSMPELKKKEDKSVQNGFWQHVQFGAFQFLEATKKIVVYLLDKVVGTTLGILLLPFVSWIVYFLLSQREASNPEIMRFLQRHYEPQIKKKRQ